MYWFVLQHLLQSDAFMERSNEYQVSTLLFWNVRKFYLARKTSITRKSIYVFLAWTLQGHECESGINAQLLISFITLTDYCCCSLCTLLLHLKEMCAKMSEIVVTKKAICYRTWHFRKIEIWNWDRIDAELSDSTQPVKTKERKGKTLLSES